MSAGIVIAGGGLAAQRCCETLRACGYDGSIRLVCAEERPPYDRPPLSKRFLAGAMTDAQLALRSSGWYARNRVDLLLSTPAVALDPAHRRLELSRGGSLTYDKLLIATGAAPRPGPWRDAAAVLGSARDAGRLRAALAPGARIAIVGAGFVGLEVASTATALGVEVTVVEAAPAPLAAAVGPRAGAWFADLHRAAGVELVLSARVARVTRGAIHLDDGRRIECDRVLVAIGVRPQTAWLESCGLGGDGVPTDSDGRTAAPGVYAAGDAAAAPEPLLGGLRVGGHWESAARQGAAAARAMLGLPSPPARPPSFWSDQHGVRIQLVGHAALADAVEIDAGRRELSAVYTCRGRTVARLLAGRPRELREARAAVREGLTALAANPTRRCS